MMVMTTFGNMIGWLATLAATLGVVMGIWLISLTLRQSRQNNAELRVVSDSLNQRLAESQRLTRQLLAHVEQLDPSVAALAAREVLETARFAAETLARAERALADKKTKQHEAE